MRRESQSLSKQAEGFGFAEDSAVALFNDVVSRTMDKDRQAATGEAAAATSSMAEWEMAAKFKELIYKPEITDAELTQIKTDLWPHVESQRGNIPKHLYIAATEFLAKACRDVVKNGTTSQVITLSNMYHSIGVWDLAIRNLLVMNLCHVLICEDKPQEGRDAVAGELIKMWKHISHLKRRTQPWESEQFIFPSPSDMRIDIEKARQGQSPSLSGNVDPTTRVLTAMFPQHQPSLACRLVPGLLTTVTLLLDEKRVAPSFRADAAPLFQTLAAAMGSTGLPEGWLGAQFNAATRFPEPKLSQLASYVVEQWQQAATSLADGNAGWRGGHNQSAEGGRGSKNRDLSSIHRQLRLAYRSRHLQQIPPLWANLNDILSRQPSARKQLAQEPNFFDFWIFVWCAIRRPAMIQETFHLMKELGVPPTVKTYTAMMHGWKMCKDIRRIESLWESLVKSGMSLDQAIWTERISALIELGKPEASLQALTEMQKAGRSAPQGGDGAGSVALTVEAVNAAFKGLIRVDPKAAQEVLAWAGHQGIEPDVRTYNILLQERFRHGPPGAASSILKSMKERGIEPDGATFTIILEEVLGSFVEAADEEQAQAVGQILSDIEDAGLKPNLETYGKMLYAVVSLPHGGADAAIAAIQKHMRANDIVLSPHMVTMLVERVSQRDPPDVQAMRGILRGHGLTDVTSGDQTLWERVMSAYAVGSQTDDALRVFDDLAGAGRPVSSLPCLRDLVQALLTADRAEDARRVVGQVVRSKTQRQEHVPDRYWRHHFWFVADANGLLNGQEIPPELRKVLMAQN